MSKTFLINSTLAPGEIYFRGTADYLNRKGIETEIILPNSWKLEEYENFVSDEIKQEKRINLVGHSYAGNVAFNISEKNPDNVDKLLIVDSILDWKHQPLSDKMVTHFLGRLPDYLKEKVGGNKSVIKFMLNGMIDSDMDKKTFNNLIETAEISGGKWNIKALYDGIEYTNGRNYIKRLEELSKKIDTHFIYASKSVGEYVEKQNIENIIGSGNMHKIENSGHLISLENPGKFNQTLEKIIES